jgi:hypothetical protein
MSFPSVLQLGMEHVTSTLMQSTAVFQISSDISEHVDMKDTLAQTAFFLLS